MSLGLSFIVLLHGDGIVGAGTDANGSGCGMVNGNRVVPVAQLSVLSSPPTAATGHALTSELPNATAASIEIELVIMPQPRSTLALPPAVMPVVFVLSRLTTQ